MSSILLLEYMYYFIDFNPGIFRNPSCLPDPIQSGGHNIAKIHGSDDKKQLYVLNLSRVVLYIILYGMSVCVFYNFHICNIA